MVEALHRQASTLNVHSRYLHEGVLDYAERLTDLHADPLASVVFACTGTEANEVAMSMARVATGGRGFICTDAAYHGNRTARWFHSDNRGADWHGPRHFGGLLDDPNLTGLEFTSRTAYLVDGPGGLLLFGTARDTSQAQTLAVMITEKTFLARSDDGGLTFSFVSWIVSWDDNYRAAMPSPVRAADNKLVVGIRRKSSDCNWIDCFRSTDNGGTWAFLSRITETEVGSQFNGNPPALIRLGDGRLCCGYGNRTDRVIAVRYSQDDGGTWSAPVVVRDGFQSAAGAPDLGYPRIWQRTDGKLVAAYFWCTAERPQTHIEYTIFEAP